MKNKRTFAVLGLSVVGALSLSAWVVLRAPPASTSLFTSESTTERMDAEDRGERPSAARPALQLSEPTSEQMYAAGHGEPFPPRPAVQPVAEPTSAELHAARDGACD
jgi:hypothetical protein